MWEHTFCADKWTPKRETIHLIASPQQNSLCILCVYECRSVVHFTLIGKSFSTILSPSKKWITYVLTRHQICLTVHLVEQIMVQITEGEESKRVLFYLFIQRKYKSSLKYATELKVLNKFMTEITAHKNEIYWQAEGGMFVGERLWYSMFIFLFFSCWTRPRWDFCFCVWVLLEKSTLTEKGV